MKIYTLTLSPAYDVHAVSEGFAAGKENLVTVTSRDAGGKGINISRALKSVGVETVPVLLLGRENSAEYEQAIQKDGLSPIIIHTGGRIRENLTVHHDGGETRISYRGADAPSGLAELLKSRISPAPCDVLTVTGRLPEGVTPTELYPYLKELRESGVRLVIDSRSYRREDIAALRPWLIKPNREEICEYSDGSIDGLSEVVWHRDDVLELGAEHALLTFDREGAALITENDTFTLHAPEVNAVSTIGAGDSAIAGFIYAYVSGMGLREALRYSVAFGSAATLTEGTMPPRRDDIKSLLKKTI